MKNARKDSTSHDNLSSSNNELDKMEGVKPSDTDKSKTDLTVNSLKVEEPNFYVKLEA